jgi:Uri superfamily endonuclease
MNNTTAMESERPAVIPNGPGTYALLLACGVVRRVVVGRLGPFRLRPGWYVYAGSAFGPGGLRARIDHHRRLAARPHWHIDYLRRHTRFAGVWYTAGVRCEHEWARLFREAPGAEIPVRRFGSSDCDCPAHLFRFEDPPAVTLLRRAGFPAGAVCE